MKWPLVRITWVDSSSYGQWTRLNAAMEHSSLGVESVGWLFDDASDRISIAAHVQVDGGDGGGNPSLDGVMTIPKCAITKRVILVKASA